MTCKEKYMQDHYMTAEDMVEVMEYLCPHVSNGINIDAPDYCQQGNDIPECIKCWNREIPGTTTEAVNHPKHYGREGAMECIDEMVLVFGVQATMNFCLLNAWKYRYRAGAKGGEEDLQKSDWYLSKYKKLKGD